MSTASHAASGHRSFGGLLSRVLFIIALWAGLVFATMHYLGHVIPTAYQISLAKSEAAEAAAKAAGIAEISPAPGATAPAAASATPAKAPAAASAAASASATPAASAGSATTAPTASATPAAPADKKLPKDVLLAGYNRTALTNVAIFYSIVISTFCVGAIILQLFKYKHVEEELVH